MRLRIALPVESIMTKAQKEMDIYGDALRLHRLATPRIASATTGISTSQRKRLILVTKFLLHDEVSDCISRSHGLQQCKAYSKGATIHVP